MDNNKDVFSIKEKKKINQKKKEMHDLIENLWIDYINSEEELRRLKRMKKTNQTK